jgi:hypothetical protein
MYIVEEINERSRLIRLDLTVQDLLQKDVKHVVGQHLHLIMSSLPMNYTVQVNSYMLRSIESRSTCDCFSKTLLDREQILDDLDEFLLHNGNAHGVIITSIVMNNDDATRQLAIYMKQQELITIVEECLRRTQLELNLSDDRLLAVSHARMKLFDQHNVRASRKQILPFMEQLVNEFHGYSSIE